MNEANQNEASHTLEEIRRTEMEAARTVDEARERAAEIVAGARARGREMVEEGRQRGRDTARRRLEGARRKMGAEADAIRSRGESEAADLSRSAEDRLGALVSDLVELVLAPPREQGG